MAALRWLHLTDLHVGSTIPASWQGMLANLDEDLAKTQRYAGGPFDLVLFTGDLVQRGNSDEYLKLDEVLDDFWGVLKKHGSNPVLLAVPGNHDLVRPAEHLSAGRAIVRWKDEPDFPEIFWDNTKGREYRDVVTNAFGPYSEWIKRWRDRYPLPSWIKIREEGKIPGDFAATIDRDGIKLGVIGLNSTFLQLSKRIGLGDLILDPRQFHVLCDNRPQAWIEHHDLSLLMSHHPPEWLSPSVHPEYKNQIYRTNWFFGHFCGHLHVARAEERRIGGAETERIFQGTSLLGEMELETRDGKRIERIIGYGATRLERKDTDFEMRLWPRLLNRGPDGRDQMVPDRNGYRLEDDRSAVWPRLGRSLSTSHAFETISTSPAKTPVSEPPGRGYNVNWYVPPPKDPEPAILANLANPGTPVVLMAPPLFGKSTFLQRIVSRLREEDQKRDRGGLVLTLNLGALSEQAPENPETCIRELAELLAEQYNNELARIGRTQVDGDAWVTKAWARPSAAELKLRWLLQKNIINQSHDRIVLVIDRFDRLAERPASFPVAQLLRSFSEEAQQDEGDWSKVRIILATTGSHALLRTRIDAVSELFNTTFNVRLEPLGLRELRVLRDRYGVDWSDDHLKTLHDLTGGWPYLSRQILYLASGGIPTNELLDEQRLMAEHCSLQLRQLWLHVCEYDQLRRVVCALLDGATLGKDESQMLHHAGLARHNASGTGYEMNARLVETYFKERCCAGASRVGT